MNPFAFGRKRDMIVYRQPDIGSSIGDKGMGLSDSHTHRNCEICNQAR